MSNENPEQPERNAYEQDIYLTLKRIESTLDQELKIAILKKLRADRTRLFLHAAKRPQSQGEPHFLGRLLKYFLFRFLTISDFWNRLRDVPYIICGV